MHGNEQAINPSESGYCGLTPFGFRTLDIDTPMEDYLDDEEVDFQSVSAVNKRYLSECRKDQSQIAALNDRLVQFIERGRSLEEENEIFEQQIEEIWARQEQFVGAGQILRQEAPALSAIAEKLRKEKDEIIAQTNVLRKDLDVLRWKYDETVKKQMQAEEEREELAQEIDVTTGECLALKEQINILENELALMGNSHEQMKKRSKLVDENLWLALEFPSPNMSTAALDIGAYYGKLASSIQFEGRTSGLSPDSTQAQRNVNKGDDSHIKIPELEKELEALKVRNMELNTEIEEREITNEEEIAFNEEQIHELGKKLHLLNEDIKTHLVEYEELLTAKRALDIEITAYRGFIEEEDERLCHL
ncbi:type III intermediate filament [Heptranchias perlo]|uniref:type III intermediate filament n=1 Tax=Heptranchias perlo TaxID=212740 RepID=UPI00355ABBC4